MRELSRSELVYIYSSRLENAVRQRNLGKLLLWQEILVEKVEISSFKDLVKLGERPLAEKLRDFFEPPTTFEI